MSPSGTDYRAIEATRQTFFAGAGDYGYWKPVLYEAELDGKDTLLKIDFTGEMQISRVELRCAQK